MKQTLANLKVNVVALSVLQITNYLIPLATIPFLTRVLGVEAFGKIALVQVTMQLGILLTDYGFNWHTTPRIAANRKDHEFLNTTFTTTWLAQWFLFLAATLLLVTATQSISLLQQDADLFLVGLLILLGYVLFPLWYLQGLERLFATSVIQLVSRLLSLPWLFVFVRGPDDALIALLIIGLAPVVAGVICLLWMFFSGVVRLRLTSLKAVLTVLRQAGLMFLSKAAVSIYAQVIPIMVGALTGSNALAYFNVADRARRAAQSLLSPLAQAMFPRMSHLFANEPDKAERMLFLSLAITLLVSSTASLALWFGADLIVYILGGAEFAEAATILRWLAPIPVMVGLSNIFGTQVMIPHQMGKAFTAILVSSALVGLMLAALLIPSYGGVGGAIALLCAEVMVTLLMGGVLLGKGLLGVKWIKHDG